MSGNVMGQIKGFEVILSSSFIQAFPKERMELELATPLGKALSEAKAHMNPEQILEAERLVEAWKSQHTRPQ